ncbi:MAG: hypothetical protein E7566_06265 [Ruminococcaceae bacterium]|nr:hypothetical protein [Oscillospiraceae bacterium]
MPQNAFLKLLKSALDGETLVPDLNISKEKWRTVFRLAENHRVLPLIFNCIKSSYPYDESDLLPLKQRTKILVLEQILRSKAFLEVYEKLCEQGLSPVVVKGIMCRNLYSDGDCRFSTDEDLFVSEEDFEQYLKAFEALSFTAKPSKGNNYQTTLCNETGLHIELHKSLFPLGSEYFKPWNQIFINSLNNTRKLTIDGVYIKTLCETDNLIYLMLHALKHFFHSGVGIRQVCDIIMYANQYGTKIDWSKFFEILRSLQAENFALAVLAIGEKHLNFNKDKANFPEHIKLNDVSELPLLEDILTGGVFGSSSMARQHSSGLTFDAVQSKKTGLFRQAFPSAKKLGSKYAYAKKCPLLLPVAWAHRLITYKKETSQIPDNHPAATIQIGKRRLKLLSFYGLISK